MTLILALILATAPSPPKDSTLVAAAKTYPGVRFHEGLRDPFLVQMAQGYAEEMARINSQSYRGQGHFGWSKRSAEIRRVLNMSGVEVSAEVRSYERGEIGHEAFNDWRRSPGHWGVVSQPHRRFGDGLSRSRQGTMFFCIVVAD